MCNSIVLTNLKTILFSSLPGTFQKAPQQLLLPNEKKAHECKLSLEPASKCLLASHVLRIKGLYGFKMCSVLTVVPLNLIFYTVFD